MKFRNKPISLLEIGVQNGGMLEIWSKYFPKAERLLGCDIDERCRNLSFEDPRIKVFVGDANAPETLSAIIQDTSVFDIIIDDGSHIVSDVIKSFSLFFPRLRAGGLYVIEDLHTSYWPDYGGGTDLQLTSMGFLKLLADICNNDAWRNDRNRLNYLVDYEQKYLVSLDDAKLYIDEISFADSICIIRKGDASSENRRVIAGTIFQTFDQTENKKISGSLELLEMSKSSFDRAALIDMQSEYLESLRKIPQYAATVQALHEERELILLKSEKEHAELHEITQKLGLVGLEVSSLQDRLARVNDELESEKKTGHEKIADLASRLNQAEMEIDSLTRKLTDADEAMRSMKNSRSWRLSKPVRYAERLLGLVSR
jgi:hypothetical protein